MLLSRQTRPQPVPGWNPSALQPKVACSSQPWAGGRNPFGIAFRLAKSLLFICLIISAFSSASLAAVVFTQDFSSNPTARAWQAFGNTNLFRWNATNENLEVTWDSSQPNSYFHLALPAVLAKDDDFAFSFDLRLDDIAIGVNPQKPFSFQVALGFINWQSATSTNLQRGSGVNAVHGPRSVAEFDYFPDSGFGATISPTIVSSNNQFATGFDFPLELDPGHIFHVAMNYTAATMTLSTTMTRDGQAFGPIHDVALGASFTDFRLDQFAVLSYSHEGADGSLLAHGTVDNIVTTIPGPPVETITGRFTNGTWQVQFNSRSNWMYSLERTIDLWNWSPVSVPETGTGGQMMLEDNAPPSVTAFYRIHAERP
jgi:hypothetical protein